MLPFSLRLQFSFLMVSQNSRNKIELQQQLNLVEMNFISNCLNSEKDKLHLVSSLCRLQPQSPLRSGSTKFAQRIKKKLFVCGIKGSCHYCSISRIIMCPLPSLILQLMNQPVFEQWLHAYLQHFSHFVFFREKNQLLLFRLMLQSKVEFELQIQFCFFFMKYFSN